MPRPTRPAARRAAAVVLAAAAVSASAGCAVSPVVNQFSTELQYAPSDGVQAYFPLSQTDAEGPGTALLVRNLLLIGPEEDGPARLYGVLVNESLDEVSVEISGPGGLSGEVTVPARTSVPLGEQQTEDLGSQELPEGAEVSGDLLADPVGAVPGELVPVTMVLDGAVLEVETPLLNGSLPEYQTLVPTGAPTPTPGGVTATAPGEPEGSPVGVGDDPESGGGSGAESAGDDTLTEPGSSDG
ncbi:hypothetical protein [uncultured Pseudokineococcus sp.]|uniref:hypothetical protein n=1 Tax=uncultured Pseudokineococcus sp. TaxID=1642928 RepID=UPI002620ED59|nr:hypothetical protein [uncultured Pseudokineococcus sp.]